MLDGDIVAMIALEPVGSLIYKGTAEGTFGGGDDTYALHVDANQPLALRVTSTDSSNLTVDPAPMGALVDLDPGPGLLYQPLKFANSSGGIVRISIGGNDGNYTIEAALNAQFDQEGCVTPQALDAGTIAAGNITRGAVIGALDPVVPRVLYEATPDNNDLPGSWDQLNNTNTWQINGGSGVTGTIASRKSSDDDWWWFKGQAGDTVTIRTSGSSSGGGTLRATTLTLWDATSGARTPGTRVPGMASDSIIDNFELPASGFYVVIVGAASGSGTYTLTVDLTTPKDPRPNSTDAYTFYAEAGQYISFAAATGRATVAEPMVQLALYAPGVDPVNGTPVATSSPRGTLDGLIEYAPVNEGLYTITVTAAAGVTSTPIEYNLLAVNNGTVDAGINGDFLSAQEIKGLSGVLGELQTSTSTFVSAGSGGLKRAIGIDFGPDGKLFVASYNSDEVMRYQGPSGSSPGAPAGISTSRKSPAAVFVKAGLGGLDAPEYLRFGPDRNGDQVNDLYVVSSTKNQVLCYCGKEGVSLGVFVTTSTNGLYHPVGLVFGPDSNNDGVTDLYVGGGNSVHCYSGANGTFIKALDPDNIGGLVAPEGLAFDSDGKLYVSSSGTDQVLRYDNADEIFEEFVWAGSGGLDEPTGLAFGPDGNLYVSSRITNEVLRYNGTPTSAAGPTSFIDAYVTASAGGLVRPGDLAWGPDGKLYVAGQDQSIVYRINVGEGDYYKVALTAGGTYTFSTSTPESARGLIDPRIDVYDLFEASVLEDKRTILDMRGNETVTYTLTAGTYYIKVSADNSTSGDYVLNPIKLAGQQSTAVSQPLDYTMLAAAAVYGNGSSRASAADKIFSDFGATVRKTHHNDLAAELVDIDYLFSK